MKKIAIIYYSGTGNTEQMANAVLEGANGAHADVTLFNVSDITAADALTYDVLVLGCPAMGAETLEEGEFEPLFAEMEANLTGKDVALFGSYGWGDGEWMRTWQDRVTAAGANLVHGEGLICNETPDDDALAACRDLGAEVAAL